MRSNFLITAVAAGLAIFTLILTYILQEGLADEIESADLAVVLGTRVLPDGRPSPMLKARLDKALELYQKGFFPQLIVSGGVGVEGFDEAEVMKKYLIKKGVPASAVFADSTGANTYKTAETAAQIAKDQGCKRVMVVTQHFHITRSKLALRRFGLSPVYGAHAAYFGLRDLYSTIREVPALIYYLLRRY